MAKVTEKYKKEKFDEEFLQKFNLSLTKLEDEYIRAAGKSHHPVIFICGAPRSGTTLVTQVLARTSLFNYIDNFIARFWRAPFVGFYVEKLVGLREMLNDTGYTFTSEFGRTHGILDPHEFAYFWEYWLKPTSAHHIIPAGHLKKINRKGLQREINAMLNIYNNPVFFKSIWFMSNPLLAYKLFNHVYFIFITRDLLTNALSILEAREKYHGDKNEWFSVCPPDYKELKSKSVEMQIVGQINSIHNEIIKQTKMFPERVIRITYEELCKNPLKTIMKITDYIGLKGIDVRVVQKRIPKRFAIQKIEYSSEILKTFKRVL